MKRSCVRILNGSDLPLQEHAGRGYRVPNGALYSTVGDPARFVAFALGEGPEIVLKREVLRDAEGSIIAHRSPAEAQRKLQARESFRNRRFDGALDILGHGETN